MNQLKVGDKFIAIVKKGPHSRTVVGVESAGVKLGPFVATKVSENKVVTESHQFYDQYFSIIKLPEKRKKCPNVRGNVKIANG